MDHERFDDLTRAIAARLPRRAALRALTAVAATPLALLGAPDTGGKGKKGTKKKSSKGKRKKKGGKAPRGKDCSPPCGDCELCVDGECGRACAACETCQPGQPLFTCVSSCDAESCQVCDEESGQCVWGCGECDLCSDGECGPACGPCETCQFSPGIECLPKCDANACERCSERDGSCVSACGECELCVDGECGWACGPCEVCQPGVPFFECVPDPDPVCACESAPGMAYCPDREECVDTRNNKDHCGGCGNACAWCGHECPAYRDSFMCCDGTCRRISEDRNNCGACGVQCAYEEECRRGQCVPACEFGDYPRTFCGRNLANPSDPLGHYICTSDTHPYCEKTCSGQWSTCYSTKYPCLAECAEYGNCGCGIPDECRAPCGHRW